MRELFPQYYPPSSDDFAAMWHNAIFVFDANTLLNCYRYTPSTWDDFLKVLEALRGRVWIPHQVGLEFSRNRLTVIAEQNHIYNFLDKYKAFVQKEFEQEIQHKYRKRGHFFANLEKIETILRQTQKDLQQELDQARQRYPEPRDADPVLDRLDRLFHGKIGPAYSDEQLARLSNEFKQRYQYRVPPGYKDSTKKPLPTEVENPSNPGNIYGDVIFWFQIIDYAKEQQHPIILVIDDGKEDWWREIAGKKVGPRPELTAEMREKAGVSFHMYMTETFIQRAQEYISIQIKQETLDELHEQRLQETDAVKAEEHDEFIQELFDLARGFSQERQNDRSLTFREYATKRKEKTHPPRRREQLSFFPPDELSEGWIYVPGKQRPRLEDSVNADEEDDPTAHDDADE